MSNSSYSVGKFLGRNWLGLLVAACFFALWGYLDSRPVEQPTSPVTAQKQGTQDIQAAKEKRDEEERLRRCTTESAALRAEAKALMKAKDPQKAFELLAPCRNLPIDQDTTKLITEVLTATRANDEIRIKREALAEKSRRKKEGVSIGMTQQEVLDSSWGRPQRINKTTSANYQHEQWVYDGGYLYFESGILKTIQH
ncbi:hypothetical protein [Polaromonas sp. JS666]|uniref:hypothetical protein n=1 Tax=Polaromonas sp. (strain JS666 / ATCC BAA-500) TaxID=296591 RepID=UPI0012ED0A8E|nr:hypothetical protein [Polaromonas sp. JS666]